MNTIMGVMRNGQVILDEPADLPEGTRVEVVPVEPARTGLGMREEDWPTTPEGTAALLARMDQVEPGWLSPEDDEAWRKALREQKEFDKARFSVDAEKLRRTWE
jgi:hypothetical protein